MGVNNRGNLFFNFPHAGKTNNNQSGTVARFKIKAIAFRVALLLALLFLRPEIVFAQCQGACPPPAAPPKPTAPAIDGDGNYQVSVPNTLGSYGYTLWNTGDTTPAGNPSVLFVSGKPNGTYIYKAKICYYQGNICSSWSPAATVEVVIPPPPIPSIIVPENSGNGIYTVSWSNSANATGFVLEEQINGGGWSLVQNSSAINKVFSGKASDSYGYQVKACNNNNVCSAWTAAVTVDVAIAPDKPASLSIAPVLNDGDQSISWDASTGSVTYYDLDQKFNGGAWTNAYAGGDLGVSINDLAVGDYLYQLRACRTSGSFTQCSGWVGPEGALAAIPDAPVLDLPLESTGSYSIAWDEVLNINEYRLEEKFNGGTWAIIYQGSNVSYGVTRPQGQYEYRVRACNDLGCGVSESVTNYVIGPPGMPGPINGPASDDDGMYGLSWTASTGIVDEYQLEERYNNSAWVAIYTGAAMAYTVTVSQVGGYEYRLLARNTAGDSAYTAIKSVTVTINSSGTVNDPIPPVLATPPSASSSEVFATDQAQATNGEFGVTPGGQASYSIDILTAPAGGNYVPGVSLSYSSGGGNGLVGLGWSLNGMGGVSRCRQTEGQDKNAAPIAWNESDRFCLNGDRLLVVSGSYGAPSSTYNTEIDSYSRITAVGGTLGRPDHFKVEQKDGTIQYYGQTSDSKYSLATNKILTWAISSSADSAGNRIEYSYTNDSAGQRIETIDYAFDNSGNNPAASLEFTYENRSDPINGYVSGHAYATAKRLKAIESRNNGSQIRKYNLNYDQGSANTAIDTLSRLTSLEECVNTTCLAPTTFEWAIPAPQWASAAGVTNLTGEASMHNFSDINGDGLIDVAWLQALDLESPVNPLAGHYALGAINSTTGEFGFQDALFTDGSYLKNWGTQYGQEPNLGFLVDFNGDGRSGDSVPQADGTWRLASVPISHSGQAVLDANADGIADVMNWPVEKPWNSYYFATVDYRQKDQNNNYIWVNKSLKQYMPPGSTHMPSLPSGAVLGDIPSGTADYRNGDLHLAPIHSLTGITGDFNGDGRVDVVANIYAAHGPCYRDDYSGFDGCETQSLWPAIFTSYPAADGGIELRFFSAYQLDAARNFFVSDLNNDGLSDLLYWRNNFEEPAGWRIRLNNGAGFDDAVVNPMPGWQATDNPSTVDASLADWNSDGYPDLIWHAPNTPVPLNQPTSSTLQGKVKVRYWNPQLNRFDETDHILMSLPYHWIGSYAILKSQAIQVMDMNGDGNPDLVLTSTPGGGGVQVYLNTSSSTATENKIVRIETGLGAETEIDYEPLTQSDHYSSIRGVNGTTSETVCQAVMDGNTCWSREIAKSSSSAFYGALNDPWQVLPTGTQHLGARHAVLDLISSMSVVTEVRHASPVADPDAGQQIDPDAQSVFSYYYERARMQAAGRGFLGFKEFSVVDHQTGLRSVSKFRQDWPFIGTAWKTELRTQSNHLLNETWNRWGFVNCYDSAGNPDSNCDDTMRGTLESSGNAALGSLQLFLRESESKTYALLNDGAGQGSQLSRTVNHYLQDSFGNTVEDQSIIYSGQSTLVLDKTTSNAYSYSGSTWSLQQGRLNRMDVSSTNGTETLDRSSSFTYYTSGDAIGLLKTETIEPEEADYTVTTTHLYDGFGNKIQSSTVADGQTRSSRVVYDSYGRYVDKTYERFSGNVERLTNQVMARDNYGQPTTMRSYVDANHFITTTTATSAFGIPYFKADSSGVWVKTTAGRQDENPESLCPATTVTWTRIESAGGGESLVCLDIRGRTLRKATRLFDGAWSVVDSEYDASDRTVRTSEPYVPGTQTSYWRENRNYDRLGRVRLIEHPDNTESSIVYNGYTTETTNAKLQARKETINPLGQKVKVTDPLNGDTLFAYDPRGNLKTMTDPALNTTVIGYDLRDRKISMTDPDKGNWQYQYNRFNELTCQKDGKNQLTIQGYDLRGRMVNRVDYEADSANTCANPEGAIESNVTWTYDTAAYGLGKLDLVEDNISDYVKQASYDTLGRLSQTRTTLRGYNNQLSDHFEKLTYDEFGRPFQVFDAARNTDSFNSNGIEHEYNAYGHLRKLKNAVISGSLQETYYEVEQMDARGNVTQAVYGNGVTRGAGYDDQTGHTLSLTANTVQGYLQNLELEWDEVGNLEYRHETGLGKGTQARDLYEDFTYDAMNRLTQSDLTGDHTASITIAYNSIGNITSKTGVGSYSYNPSGSGSVRPHAVIETVGTTTTTYAYDANGNQTGDSGGRSISYIVADLPKVITKGSHTTEFFYGPDRNRYKRIDTNGSNSTTTLYLGSVEKVYNPDNTIQWKRDIAGMVLITLTFNSSGVQTASDTRYLVKDHLGTLSLIFDNTGIVVEEFYFDAWGKRREILLADIINIFSKPITTRGYTGHEMLDDVGLIHMNGRIYDDTLSRFVQADPIIQDPFKTESLNRYSYVWNNPLNATDPSGFEPDCGAGGEQVCPVEPKQAEELQEQEGNRKSQDSGMRWRVTDQKAFKEYLKGIGMTEKTFKESMEKSGISKASSDNRGARVGEAIIDHTGNVGILFTVKNQDASKSGAAKATEGDVDKKLEGSDKTERQYNVGTKYNPNPDGGYRVSEMVDGSVYQPRYHTTCASEMCLIYGANLDQGDSETQAWIQARDKEALSNVLETTSTASNATMIVFPVSAPVFGTIGFISDVGVAAIKNDGEEMLPGLMGSAFELKLKKFGVPQKVRTRVSAGVEEFLDYLDD